MKSKKALLGKEEKSGDTEELGPTGPRFLIHEVCLLTASSLAEEEELPEPLTKKKGGTRRTPTAPLSQPLRDSVCCTVIPSTESRWNRDPVPP